MSSNPFTRSCGVNDIIRPGSPPRRPGFAGSLLLIFALSSLLSGCAPTRPIPPTRTASSDVATTQPTFDANQRARLAHLHAALAAPPSPTGETGLSIRLAFDEGADLDLFVTDPAQESVYFANSPTRSGGTLIEDRKCDNQPPRVEAVIYADPMPGRYRVGVDFHRVCQNTEFAREEARQGLYVVRVDAVRVDAVRADEGARVIEREGMVIPGQFEVIVLEFEVE